ncbi:MAG: hypothetical protein ACYS9X_23125 [Planctomycetota bacterium]|jgi:hypothetical protein
MVSERTRNIFEYLCAVLRDGLASPGDVRRFIGDLRELSEKEMAFLEGAFMEDLFTEATDNTRAGGASPVDTEA